MNYLLVLLLSVLALSSVRASNIECEFCDFIVGYVEGFVIKNTTEAKIIIEVEKACNFTGGYKTICNTMVQSYLPEIINSLTQREPASVICNQIKMCNSTSAPVAKVGGAVECTACEFITGQVEKYLEQNSTESQIQTFLDKDCKIFGGVSSICQGLVNQYLPQIIALVSQKQNASVVCGEIKLCKNNGCEFSKEAIKEKDSGVICTICQAVVKEAEQYVGSNQTVTQILQEVDQFVCDGDSICDLLVNTYGAEIIQTLINSENPDTVCDQVGLCQSSSEASSSADSQSSQTSGSAQTGSSNSGSYSYTSSGQTSGFTGSSNSGSGSGASFKIYVQ